MGKQGLPVRPGGSPIHPGDFHVQLGNFAEQPSDGAEPGKVTQIARGVVADIWLHTTEGPLPVGARSIPNSDFELIRMSCVAKILRFHPKTCLDNLGHFPTKNSQEVVNAVKKFEEELKARARLWEGLRHPNIVNLYSFNDSREIWLEYCPHGTAKEYFAAHKQNYVLKSLAISGILEGVLYLHSQNPPVIHGSLNAAKILLGRDFEFKIADFSVSSLAMSFSLHLPSVGDIELSRWMSPELIAHDPDDGGLPFTPASDIWALGCTLLEIITGRIPYWQHKHELRVRMAIMQGNLPAGDKLHLPPRFEYLAHAVMSCWERSPEDRPPIRLLKSTITAPRYEGSSMDDPYEPIEYMFGRGVLGQKLPGDGFRGRHSVKNEPSDDFSARGFARTSSWRSRATGSQDRLQSVEDMKILGQELRSPSDIEPREQLERAGSSKQADVITIPNEPGLD